MSKLTHTVYGILAAWYMLANSSLELSNPFVHGHILDIPGLYLVQHLLLSIDYANSDGTNN